MLKIIKRYPGEPSSKIISVAAVEGLAFETDPTDATAAKVRLATPTGSFLGFSTREVTAEGPTLANTVFPNKAEHAAKIGDPVSLERADVVEAEGTAWVTESGTGLLASNTAVPQNIGFNAGKFRIAQTGDNVWFKLTAVMAAEDSANNFRIRLEAIR